MVCRVWSVNSDKYSSCIPCFDLERTVCLVETFCASTELGRSMHPCQFSLQQGIASDSQQSVHRWMDLNPGCAVLRWTWPHYATLPTPEDGVRAIKINDDQILQKSPVLFKRESLFQLPGSTWLWPKGSSGCQGHPNFVEVDSMWPRYCVMEHKHDPFTFYFAECLLP